MKVAAIIPARLESKRFPRKVLARETGKFVFEHVYERVLGCPGIDLVRVATDSEEVLEAGRSFGADVVMTSTEHVSGTDRVAEVADSLDHDVVINVQGDVPLIEHSDLERLVELFEDATVDGAEVVMTTLAAFGVVAFLLTTRQDEPHFSQYTATLFGIVYCGALPSFWVKLRALAYSKSATIATGASGSRFVEAWPAVLGGPEAWTTGLIVTVITVSCIIASDVGAYAFGKTFGKTQLIKISPNKTVEGAAGGLLCTMLTAFGLRQLLGWHAGVIQTVALGALIFWAAVAGDLMESVMKRNAGMKDSGDIIPGHGGFLDRFDSYMFTGISVYFYIVTVMPHWFQGLVL